jgi:hypothetical protein
MISDPRPLFPRDPQGLDDVAKKLLTKPTKEVIVPSAASIENPEKYIILEGKTHGSYSYPDMVVAMEKSHHNNNQDVTHQLLQQEHSYMLTFRQGVDFFNLLRSGKAYDGRGQQVTPQRLQEVLDDIMKVQGSWRAERFDAMFSKQGRQLNIIYHIIQPDGSLQEVTEALDDCLMKDKKPGIDLQYWLQNATPQGLPPKNIPNGDLWYWHPRDGRVARFDAVSDGACLDCDGNPQYSGSGLGVRVAKIKG